MIFPSAIFFQDVVVFQSPKHYYQSLTLCWLLKKICSSEVQVDTYMFELRKSKVIWDKTGNTPRYVCDRKFKSVLSNFVQADAFTTNTWYFIKFLLFYVLPSLCLLCFINFSNTVSFFFLLKENWREHDNKLGVSYLKAIYYFSV